MGWTANGKGIDRKDKERKGLTVTFRMGLLFYGRQAHGGRRR